MRYIKNITPQWAMFMLAVLSFLGIHNIQDMEKAIVGAMTFFQNYLRIR